MRKIPDIRLIATDLDGTLLGDDHISVSERNARALRAASEQGIRLAIASGRTRSELAHVLERLPFLDYLIQANGAAVTDLKSGRILLKHRDGVSVINMEDILLVQREERATVLYTVNDGRYVTGDSLADIEARLDPAFFMRCHKSYIINLSHVDSISPYGRWTYVVKLRGTRRDALITHEKYEELERLFG